MPGFDGTGPMGQGPMTGGGFGDCGAGYRARTMGGFGRGRGAGRGFRAGIARGLAGRSFQRARGPGYGPADREAYAIDPAEEVDLLRQEAAALQAELDSINRRIHDLESHPTAS